jgi:alpha-beta hydrolase superfamily lysophospholipase
MGGFVIQKYLENHSAPAAVLLSSPSPDGLLGTTLRIARRHPLAFAKVNVTGSLLPVIATPQLAREAFFSRDLPDEQLLVYWQQMQDESYMALLDMVALALPHPEKVTTPLLVLGAAHDNMLTPIEIAATARAYNTEAEIIPEVAHSSMLDPRWQSVAERILVWLKERRSAPGSSGQWRDGVQLRHAPAAGCVAVEVALQLGSWLAPTCLTHVRTWG